MRRCAEMGVRVNARLWFFGEIATKRMPGRGGGSSGETLWAAFGGISAEGLVPTSARIIPFNLGGSSRSPNRTGQQCYSAIPVLCHALVTHDPWCFFN